MHVDELMRLIEWVDTNVRHPRISNLYQCLAQVINENSQPRSQKRPFKTQKEDLLNGLSKPDFGILSKSQIDFLEKTGLNNLIGSNAVQNVEEILYSNSFDYVTASTELTRLNNDLKKILSNLQSIQNGLEPYIADIEEDFDQGLLSVRFKDNASISNVTELKKWSAAWWEIARGIAMVTNDSSPDDFKVVGASKGSVIIDFAANYGQVLIVAKIVHEVFNVAERIIEFRSNVEGLRKLKLENKALLKGLEEEIGKEEDKGKEIAIEHLQKALKVDGDGEQANNYKNSIDQIFKFVLNGGQIDFRISKCSDNESDLDEVQQNQIAELTETMQKIRSLETKVLLLEAKNSKDNNEEE